MSFRSTAIISKCLAIILIFGTSFSVSAGPYADALYKKMISSTTTNEKNLFIRWIFSLMSLHPELNDFSRIDSIKRNKINQDAAKVMIRLLYHDCHVETREALKFEGEASIQEAFKLFARAAVVDLMTNKQVESGSLIFKKMFESELERYNHLGGEKYFNSSKISNNIPNIAPAAIVEPHEILAHLQYTAIHQDINHLAMLDPADPMATDGAAYWFNCHSGDVNLALTAEEITHFGLQDMQKLGFIATVARAELQRKIDEFSANPPPVGFKPVLPVEMRGLDINRLDFPQTIPGHIFLRDVRPHIEKHRRALFRAGLWRLLKGVPAELWGNIRVLETRQDPNNQRAFGVFLGLTGTGFQEVDGKTILQVALFKKDDGTWGLSYWQYKVYPRQLRKILAAMKEQNE